MKIEEILDKIEFYNKRFPRRALRDAMTRKESITPELLAIVQDAAENIDELAYEKNYMAHMYAMYLLAQFRERRAYPLIVEFFSIPGEVTLDVTGELVTEDLNRILASVCGNDTSLMESLIENENVNEYVRSAALQGLLVLVARGDQSREEIMSYYRALFREKLERKPSLVWGSLVDCCCELHPKELLEEISQAFAEGLVDENYTNLEWVQGQIEQGKDRMLTDLRGESRYSYIDDTIKEMEWWACFDEPRERLQIKRKVGRNEPCPCGSGVKYKKCCGAKR
ncbi:MAG: DUF1186 domain-containing protein [Chloroflexi bacterium]|nr:DUF1186 domain-containing protein [Chloroflexota bacterium]